MLHHLFFLGQKRRRRRRNLQQRLASATRLVPQPPTFVIRGLPDPLPAAFTARPASHPADGITDTAPVPRSLTPNPEQEESSSDWDDDSDAANRKKNVTVVTSVLQGGYLKLQPLMSLVKSQGYQEKKLHQLEKQRGVKSSRAAEASAAPISVRTISTSALSVLSIVPPLTTPSSQQQYFSQQSPFAPGAFSVASTYGPLLRARDNDLSQSFPYTSETLLSLFSHKSHV
jgi:hypothetical protein